MIEIKKNAKIIDFNPFGSVTDSLLYSWDELLESKHDVNNITDFRVIEDEFGIQKNLNCFSGQPIEFLNNENLISNIESLQNVVSFRKTILMKILIYFLYFKIKKLSEEQDDD